MYETCETLYNTVKVAIYAGVRQTNVEALLVRQSQLEWRGACMRVEWWRWLRRGGEEARGRGGGEGAVGWDSVALTSRLSEAVKGRDAVTLERWVRQRRRAGGAPHDRE